MANNESLNNLENTVQQTQTPNSSDNSTDVKETQEGQLNLSSGEKLTKQEQFNVLRAVHTFFSNFDRVPGSYANSWGQALDAIGLVANSIIEEAKNEISEELNKETENK